MLTKISNDDGWKRELGVNNTPTSRAAPIPRVPVSSGNTHAKTSTNDRHVHPASREELGVHHAHARRPGTPRRRRRRRRRRRLEGVVKKRRRRRAGVRVEFAGRPRALASPRAPPRAPPRPGSPAGTPEARVRFPYLLQRRQRQAHLLGEEVAAGAPRAVGGGGPLGAAFRDGARGGRGDVLEPRVFCGTPHRARFECRLLCGAFKRCGAGKPPAGVRSGPSPEFRADAGSARVSLARTERGGGVSAVGVSVVRRRRPDALVFCASELARAGSRPRRPRAGPDPELDSASEPPTSESEEEGRGRSPEDARAARGARRAC